jgi:RNA polymerase sigma-70 factor (ECF subfamily)
LPKGPARAAEPLPASDEELVRAVLDGRDAGFEELVGRYRRPIVNFLYRMIGEYESALDLSQEVFIRVHQALERYDPRYQFSTWIYRIASNCAIDRLRRRQPSFVSLDETSEQSGGAPRLQLPSKTESPVETLQAKQTLRRLELAIHQLPPAYRKLIVLRHVNGLSYEQITAVTRLPLGTVKNRIFRARALLRREIDRDRPRRSVPTGSPSGPQLPREIVGGIRPRAKLARAPGATPVPREPLGGARPRAKLARAPGAIPVVREAYR